MCGASDFEEIAQEMIERIAAVEGGLQEETTYDGRKLRWTEDARRGQSARGRVVPSRSFRRHARRAVETMTDLLEGRRPDGWHSVTVLSRSRAAAGLRLDLDAAEQTSGVHK